MIDDIIAKQPPPFLTVTNPKLVEFEGLVRDVVSDHALGTSELIRALRPNASQAQTKAAVAWLQKLRDSGLVDDCFDRGKPAPGTFGKARIIWRVAAPVELTREQRLAAIKESDPELYAQIYAPKTDT